jgi:RNA polymerase sigma-70 factor (subfamily 1)
LLNSAEVVAVKQAGDVVANPLLSGALPPAIDAGEPVDRLSFANALESIRGYLIVVANARSSTDLQSVANPSDFVQDTLLKAVEKRGDFRGQTGRELRLWLRTILINTIREQRRRLRHTRDTQSISEHTLSELARPGLLQTDETPSKIVASRLREDSLVAAIERLPRKYGEVIVLHHRDKLTFNAIGLRLGISEDAARKRCDRGIERLRKELGPHHDSR